MGDFRLPPDLVEQLRTLRAEVARQGKTIASVESRHYVGDVGEPSFTNSWVNFDAGSPPPVGTARNACFYRHGGRVYLAGVIKTGTTATTAFTLPAGYRPGVVESHPVIASGGIAQIQVAASGTVTPFNGTGTNVTSFVFLDGISFRHG